MGKAFADLQAWDQAVDAYRIAIGPPWELNPKNPVVHQEIVNVFEIKGDKFAADPPPPSSRRATRRARAWYAANEKDREAMENQRRIAERALYAAARNTHSAATHAAQGLRGVGEEGSAGEGRTTSRCTRKAVELYRQFIDDVSRVATTSTSSRSSRARRCTAASATPRRSRSTSGSAITATSAPTYYLDAARSVLQSYEAEAAKRGRRRASSSRSRSRRSPSSRRCRSRGSRSRSRTIYLELQAEYDNYQNIVNDPAAAPQQGINAALISLAYLHVDDAIARFQQGDGQVLRAPPRRRATAPAAKAKDGILAIYEAQSNFDAIEATNKKFISAKCGDDNVDPARDHRRTAR